MCITKNLRKTTLDHHFAPKSIVATVDAEFPLPRYCSLSENGFPSDVKNDARELSAGKALSPRQNRQNVISVNGLAFFFRKSVCIIKISIREETSNDKFVTQTH